RAVRWLEARSVPEGTSSRVQRGTRRIPAPLGSPANPLGGAGSPWASAALGAAFFAIYLLLAPAVPGDKDSGEFTLVLATNGLDPMWTVETTLAEVYSWHVAWALGACLAFTGLLRLISAPDAAVTDRGMLVRAAAWGALCGVGAAHHATFVFVAAPLSIGLVI